MRKSTSACIASMMFLFRSNKLYCHQRQASNKNASKGETVKFQNYHKQLQAPFVIYADFEAIKVQGSSVHQTTMIHSLKRTKSTLIVVAHIGSCYDDKCTKPVQSYRGENAANTFLQMMLQEVEYCRNVIRTKFNKLLKMSDDDAQNFQNATTCHLCGKHKYLAELDKRVRDLKTVMVCLCLSAQCY